MNLELLHHWPEIKGAVTRLADLGEGGSMAEANDEEFLIYCRVRYYANEIMNELRARLTVRKELPSDQWLVIRDAIVELAMKAYKKDLQTGPKFFSEGK